MINFEKLTPAKNAVYGPAYRAYLMSIGPPATHCKRSCATDFRQLAGIRRPGDRGGVFCLEILQSATESVESSRSPL
jgi:hypothetical protein